MNGELFLLAAFWLSAAVWAGLTVFFIAKHQRAKQWVPETAPFLISLALVAFALLYENVQYGIATAAKYGYAFAGLEVLNSPEYWAVPKLVVIVAGAVMLWLVWKTEAEKKRGNA